MQTDILKCGIWHALTLTSYTAELNNLIFHPLEVVSHYRDSQLQVGENYSYLFN